MRALERACLAATLLLAAAWSGLRNLGAGPVTFDEDEADYVQLAEALARKIYALEPVGVFQQLIGTYRPPGPVTVDALTLLLLPPDPALLAVTRLLWVAALLWAAGALARDVTRRAGGDEARQARAGSLAILLTGTAPVVLALGASLMSEVPLAAASGVALVLLLRAMEQRTARSAAWLGLAVGGALLVKWTVPLVFAPAAAMALLVAADRKQAARLAGVAVAVAVAVAGPWYALAGGRVLDFVLGVGTGAGAKVFGAAQRTVLEEWFWYVPVLIGGLLWWPLALACFWGGARAMRQRAPGRWVLLAAVLGPALLFSLLANKEIRYLLPAVPALAALGAVGLSSARGRALPVLAALGLVGALPALVHLGVAPSRAEVTRRGPLAVLSEIGPTGSQTTEVSLATPVGPLPLWSRRTAAFQYRQRVHPALPLHELDDLVQSTNPGGPRDAAVLSPSPWIRTPLWARSMRTRSWTRWRSAACDPRLVTEASYYLTVEPPGEMQHCQELTRRAEETLRGMQDELQLLGTWRVGPRVLRLYAHRGRLYRLERETEDD